MSDCPDSGQTINRRQLRVALAEPNVSHAEKEKTPPSVSRAAMGLLASGPSWAEIRPPLM
jgi:hypothetical protein